MAKIRKSKYGFASLKVGDKFQVKAFEIPSMQSSLSRFNKNSNEPKIKIDIFELSDSTAEITRIS